MAKEEDIRRSREYLVRRINVYEKTLQRLLQYGMSTDIQVFVDVKNHRCTEEERFDISELYCPDTETLKANVTMQLEKLKTDLRELLK